MAGSWRGKRRDQIQSSGYVAHSLEAALWCVGRTSSFAGAVLLAANFGADADTIAAITGQLAEALYGAGGIPDRWLDKLAWRELMTD
jgi:ADP-ribosyl-[dinitrogen reductase] hydrolase